MEKEYERRTLEIKEALEKDLENIVNNNDLVQVRAKYLGKSGVFFAYIRPKPPPGPPKPPIGGPPAPMGKGGRSPIGMFPRWRLASRA